MSEKNNRPKYFNKNIPFDERIEDLINRMTLEEKVNQMVGFGDFINVDIFIVEEGRYGYPRMEEALFHDIFESTVSYFVFLSLSNKLLTVLN